MLSPYITVCISLFFVFFFLTRIFQLGAVFKNKYGFSIHILSAAVAVFITLALYWYHY